MNHNDMLDSMTEIKLRWPQAVEVLREHIEMRGLADEYPDNFRVARSEDSWEKASYEYARRDGCCGSYDEEVLIGGVKFMIGCNYGH